MTREIKFRAYDKERKKIKFFDLKEIYADCYHNVGFLKNAPHQHENDGWEQFELMRFTGLLDKNGKEIYEGDIISTPHFFNWTITGYEKRKVFFKDGAFGVKENEHGFIALKSLFKGVESSKTYISNYGEVYREFQPVFEVIGNIYQNPELINK
jgi:uncharacterized phage protein (TIGR01671 family)